MDSISKAVTIMNNRPPMIIIAVIIIIAIFLASLLLSDIFPMGRTTMEKTPENFTHVFKDNNSSPNLLPHEIRQEIQQHKRKNFTLNKWEFNLAKRNEINLYVHDIRSENAINEFQGEQIGNYTIHLIHDTEFEASRAEVFNYLWGLRKNPVYQINSVSMTTDRINDPPENIAEVWAYKSTPENKALDNTIIKGWRIQIFVCCAVPSLTGTLNNRTAQIPHTLSSSD